MTRFAKLTSIDVVRAMAAALRKFEEEAGSSLADLQMDVNRVHQWIHQDRKQYWAEQVRRGYQEVAEAKATLERRLIYRATDERPSCREEKANLEKAKQRLRTAQDKVQVVKQWTNTLEHEIREFRASIAQLADWLQSDLPHAVALLQRMRDALDDYVNLESSEDGQGIDWIKLMTGEEIAETAGRPPAEEPVAPPAVAADPTAPREVVDEDVGPEHGLRQAGIGDASPQANQVGGHGSME